MLVFYVVNIWGYIMLSKRNLFQIQREIMCTRGKMWTPQLIKTQKNTAGDGGGVGCMHYFCIPTDYSRWSNVWLVKNVWVFFLFQYPTISTIFFINPQYRAFEFLHWLTDNWTPRLHGTRCSALAGLIILGILLFQC